MVLVPVPVTSRDNRQNLLGALSLESLESLLGSDKIQSYFGALWGKNLGTGNHTPHSHQIQQTQGKDKAAAGPLPPLPPAQHPYKHAPMQHWQPFDNDEPSQSMRTNVYDIILQQRERPNKIIYSQNQGLGRVKKPFHVKQVTWAHCNSLQRPCSIQAREINARLASNVQQTKQRKGILSADKKKQKIYNSPCVLPPSLVQNSIFASRSNAVGPNSRCPIFDGTTLVLLLQWSSTVFDFFPFPPWLKFHHKKRTSN